MAQRVAGSAHDFYGHQRKPLDVIFRRKPSLSLAQRARRGSVGRTILWNLLPIHLAALFILSHPTMPACWAFALIRPSTPYPKLLIWLSSPSKPKSCLTLFVSALLPVCAARLSFQPVSGSWCGRCSTGTGNFGNRSARWSPHCWPQLLGHYKSDFRLECHVCTQNGAQGNGRFHQSKWCIV